MVIQTEIILLVLSVLFFLSVFAGKASSKLGVPALLLFLAVGMLCGSDGLGIQFDNIYVAQAIGTVALCIILVSGLPAAGIGFVASLLLASTMASTDSASVFSILRGKNLNLKHNLRPMLELESGSNDPMAYMLVVTILGAMSKGAVLSWYLIVLQLLMQIVIGAVAGFLLGKFAVWVINRIKIENDALYPILVLTFCIFIFSSTYFLQGNGYLAVYIGGLVIGNSKFVHKRSSMKFFEGLAWLFQLIMFLTLGLLVNPRELVPIIVPGLIISLLMIFFTRPLAVFLSLLPFRKMTLKDMSRSQVKKSSFKTTWTMFPSVTA